MVVEVVEEKEREQRKYTHNKERLTPLHRTTLSTFWWKNPNNNTKNLQ